MEARCFSCFSSLPPEIQSKIWEFTLPIDIPEVHIWGGFTRAAKYPNSVFTDYPVIMHVCRDARHIAELKVGWDHTYKSNWESDTTSEPGISEQGQRLVCRTFQSDLDTVYVSWSEIELFAMKISIDRKFAANIQHLAVEARHVADEEYMGNALRHLKNLRTLSMVFEEVGSLYTDSQVTFVESLGRPRLRQFTPEELQSIILAPEGTPWTPRSLDEYIRDTHGKIQELMKNAVPTWGYGVDVSTWDRGTQTLKLEIKAKVFEYYRRSAGGSSCWLERRPYYDLSGILPPIDRFSYAGSSN
ncbi:hypothetical protein F4779DRAFT_256963 [Xylariaceae sp. FL0662B]|nr:hypothetical protein F4779DRAFT_256963 [Xylariaceae sp. FL0662B]